jgi:hypothetical protein
MKPDTATGTTSSPVIKFAPVEIPVETAASPKPAPLATGMGPSPDKPLGALTPVGTWLPQVVGPVRYEEATPVSPAGFYLETPGGEMETYNIFENGKYGPVNLPNVTKFLLDRGEEAGVVETEMGVFGGQIRIMPVPLTGVPTSKPAFIAVLGGLSNRMNGEPYCHFDGTDFRFIQFTNIDEHDSNDLGQSKGGLQLTALTWPTGKPGEPQPLVVVDVTEGWAFIGHENSFIPGLQFDGFSGKVKVEDPGDADRAAVQAGISDKSLTSVLRQPGSPNMDWLLDEKTSTLYRVLSGGDVGAPTVDKVIRLPKPVAVPVLEASQTVGGRTARGGPDVGALWLGAQKS